jgi:ABC-type multidrug transport system ATPase subunit
LFGLYQFRYEINTPAVHLRIDLANYRCFGDKPASIELKRGITAIIGANNSGKSTLLRFFYEFRPLFEMLRHPANLVSAVKGELGIPALPAVKDIFQLFHKRNDRDLVVRIHDLEGGRPEPVTTISINRESRQLRLALSRAPVVESDRVGILHGTMMGYHTPKSDPLLELAPTLQLFESLCRTTYIGPFRGAAEQGATGDYYDLKVGHSFVQTWNQIKTGDNAAHTDIALRVQAEIQRLFKFSQFEINATQDGRSLQVNLDNASYKIQELGAGLSQFIITFAHVAISHPNFILIDEPESNLHASLQLDFVLSLAAFAKCGLLFSTHSVGLARSVADEILAVQRGPGGDSQISEFESVERLSELVGELNFSAYQQLGFSIMLLVEGVTEVKALKQFLRQLKIEQKVLLVPLFGTAMINAKREHELEELKRITSRIFALIDSEKTSAHDVLSRDRQAFKDVCGRLGIDCHVLERRSLENYFTQDAINTVIGPASSALGDFGDMKGSTGWAKADNWRIAQRMRMSDVEPNDLGAFLAKIEAEAKK